MRNFRALLSISVISLLLPTRQSNAQTDTSLNLDNEIKKVESLVAQTMAHNHQLKEKVEILKAQIGLADGTMWDDARAINELVTNANLDLAQRATLEEFKSIDSLVGGLEDFADEIASQIEADAYLKDYEAQITPLTSDINNLTNRIAVIESQIHRIYDRALQILRSF